MNTKNNKIKLLINKLEEASGKKVSFNNKVGDNYIDFQNFKSKQNLMDEINPIAEALFDFSMKYKTYTGDDENEVLIEQAMKLLDEYVENLRSSANNSQYHYQIISQEIERTKRKNKY